MESGTSITNIDRDADERFVALRRRLGVSSFGLNEIVLKPGERGRIHRHQNQEEVYLVLAGTLSIVVEGKELELGRDQLIRVAPELRRQLVNRGSEPLILVALGGANEHVGRDAEAFASWEDSSGSPPQEIPLPQDLPASELR
jgi:mannose-6-phosphate isomerase-like protein (cupin superfamily)